MQLGGGSKDGRARKRGYGERNVEWRSLGGLVLSFELLANIQVAYSRGKVISERTMV